MSYKFQRVVSFKGTDYIVKAPSKTDNKKYDVFIEDEGKEKKILSFGHTDYQHFKDRLGYWKHLDHNDPKRQENYKSRHSKDKGVIYNDPKYSGWWSYHLLW